MAGGLLTKINKAQGGLLDQGTSVPNPGSTALGGPGLGGMNPSLGQTGQTVLSGGINQLAAPGGIKKAGAELAKYDPSRTGKVRQPGDVAPISAPQFDIQAAKVADPRAAMINMAPQDQFRSMQQNVAGQLAQQALGQGSSIANQQMKQGQEAAAAQQFAQLASARGGASPALARQAMQNNAATESQLAQQAGINRLQEQQQAAQTFGQVGGQARAQDIGLATSQAGMEQQANMAKYQGDLQSQMQLNDLKSKYASMGLSAEQSNQMAALDMEKMKNQQANAQLENQQKARQGALGTVGQLGGALMTMI